MISFQKRPCPRTRQTIFLSNHPPTTDIYTLSLHDALPIPRRAHAGRFPTENPGTPTATRGSSSPRCPSGNATACSRDRKSTRLNSSHVEISYAVFCLKKKTLLLVS